MSLYLTGFEVVSFHYFPERFLKRFYLFIFRQREGERKGNTNVCLPLVHPLLGALPTTQVCALTGNRTSDPLVHRVVLNLLIHTSQGGKFWFTFSFSFWYKTYPHVFLYFQVTNYVNHLFITYIYFLFIMINLYTLENLYF